MQEFTGIGRGWLILRFPVKERCGLHPGRIPGWGGITIGVRVGNRAAGGDSSVHYRDHGGMRTCGGC